MRRLVLCFCLLPVSEFILETKKKETIGFFVYENTIRSEDSDHEISSAYIGVPLVEWIDHL